MPQVTFQAALPSCTKAMTTVVIPGPARGLAPVGDPLDGEDTCSRASRAPFSGGGGWGEVRRPWRHRKSQEVPSAGADVATNTALPPAHSSWTLLLGLGWRSCLELLLQRAESEMNLPPTHPRPVAELPQPAPSQTTSECSLHLPSPALPLWADRPSRQGLHRGPHKSWQRDPVCGPVARGEGGVVAGPQSRQERQTGAAERFGSVTWAAC